MKTMSKMGMILGGVGLFSYMYLKKNPEKIQMMKNMGMEVSKKMYNMLNEDAQSSFFVYKVFVAGSEYTCYNLFIMIIGVCV